MKNLKNTSESQLDQPQLGEITRRGLLIWTTPVVAAIALPVHAQTSTCFTAPTLTATVPSKCAGDPPVGQAVLTLLSDAADPSNDSLEIRSITVNGAAASDTIVLPTLPANVIASVGIDIEWSGSASDAVTCLPLSTITFEVVYGCGTSGADTSITFDMTTVLAAAT